MIKKNKCPEFFEWVKYKKIIKSQEEVLALLKEGWKLNGVAFEFVIYKKQGSKKSKPLHYHGNA